MELKISMKATETVAWWGAIVATMVLIWDIIKWRRAGIRILFRVFPNQIVMGAQELKGKTFISAKVSNIGGKQTTINTLGGKFYNNWLSWLRRKPGQCFVVKEISAHRLPYMGSSGFAVGG